MRLRPALTATILALAVGLPAHAQPAAPPLDAHAALVRAELRAAQQGAREGLAAALRASGDEGLTLLWEGAPLVVGRAGALALLEAQPSLQGTRVQWQAMHAEVSRDSTVGITWGVATRGPVAGPHRFGRYLAGWRRGTDGTWRLTALAFTGLTHPDSAAVPAGLATGPRTIPPAARGPADADRAFARRGREAGAPTAFAEFAAPDAVSFGGTGELAIGPEAIRRAFSPGGASATWAWGPVHADAAASGDLGWTIGEAEITPAGGGRGFRSKYLSLWRLVEGRWLYVADGGNSRP